MPTYRILEHTADTGIEAEAETLAGLLETLAYGMFDLMWDMDEVEGAPTTGAIEFELSALRPDELAVDVLSELLCRSEAGDVALRSFSIDAAETAVAVSAETCPLAGLELRGPPIKAVTYHDLRIERAEGAWHGRIIFDV